MAWPSLPIPAELWFRFLPRGRETRGKILPSEDPDLSQCRIQGISKRPDQARSRITQPLDADIAGTIQHREAHW